MKRILNFHPCDVFRILIFNRDTESDYLVFVDNMCSRKGISIFIQKFLLNIQIGLFIYRNFSCFPFSMLLIIFIFHNCDILTNGCFAFSIFQNIFFYFTFNCKSKLGVNFEKTGKFNRKLSVLRVIGRNNLVIFKFGCVIFLINNGSLYIAKQFYAFRKAVFNLQRIIRWNIHIMFLSIRFFFIVTYLYGISKLVTRLKFLG